MLEKTRRFQSDSELDTYNYETDGPRFARYPHRRAGVAHVPDESVPLFLSDEDESEPQPYEFVRERPRRKKTFTVARVLVGSVAVVAAAGVAALFSSDATRAIIINAKASLVAALNQPGGAAARQTAALQTRLANSVQVATLGVQATTVVPSQPQPTATSGQVPAAIAALPSREEISAAMKSAHQADIRQPAPAVAAPVVAAPTVVTPPPAPAPHVEKIDPDALAGMMSRAKSLMTIGDITSARLLLQRAAEAQDADAAFMLGQTYDPAVLGSQDIRSITPDPAIARHWYQKAAQLGSADAQQRLAQMQN
ncbi:MAG TPA: hypothetical protein VMU69_09600 [Bradyrhizobium sp.]|nr:hypothetical protein [Bradyrhizobium sp.]